MVSNKKNVFKNFNDFWLYYLSAHKNQTNRILHFGGTILGAFTFFYSLITREWSILPLAPILGYFLSWTGHFLFEKNKPATFKYPLWSFIADLKMILIIFQRGFNFNESQITDHN